MPGPGFKPWLKAGFHSLLQLTLCPLTPSLCRAAGPAAGTEPAEVPPETDERRARPTIFLPSGLRRHVTTFIAQTCLRTSKLSSFQRFSVSVFSILSALTLFLGASSTAHSAEPWLSSLASPPDWRMLDRYQKSITRTEFEALLRQVYSLDGDFLRYLDLTDEKAVVYREPEKIHALWTLEFAATPETSQSRPPLFFPTDTSDLRGATPEKPLKGLRILLDPGHIGGDWATMEQRDLRIGTNPPVQEGALNMIACRQLATLLEGAGAEVLWTKTSLVPVTPLRPDDLKTEAQELILARNPAAAKLSKKDLAAAVKSRADMLFYRVSEIQARAAIVESLKPDLTLCVHFNAAPDPNPGRPGLFEKNRLVIFVNGSYLPDELPFDDIKFDLMKKILERSSPVETAIAKDIGLSMEKNWKFPPEAYTDWPSANRITDNPYVWSRNLIANRLYAGPVVFIEGPYMNDRGTYDRLIVGDYEGIKTIDGIPQRSIFREFAEIIYQGLLTYYTTPPTEGPEGSPLPSIPYVPYAPPPPPPVITPIPSEDPNAALNPASSAPVSPILPAATP